MAGDGPLDRFDPRYGGAGDEADDADRVDHRRSLVHSRGPGRSPQDPKVRILRIAVPLLAIAGVATIALVFFSGLSQGGSTLLVGPEDDVRDALGDRPYRVCFNDANPCAWLTVVDGAVVAFNTSGPLAEEYGRQGVAWCPSSGYFGANSTGSMWDQDGRIVRGPAPRSLDRFGVATDEDGNLIVRFASLNAGLAAWQVAGDVRPPDGPLCEQIPFDRAADLVLPSAG